LGTVKSLASELISPKIEINSGVEADKGARDFTATIVSVYRLPTSKITFFHINNDLPGLDRLLKLKQGLRKLWQETRDPACKTAGNWVTKAIRRMTRKGAHKRWQTKISNTEVTSQAIWPIAKSLVKRDGPKEPTAIHSASGLKCHPFDKAKATADTLEIQFAPHDLRDETHDRRVEDHVQSLRETIRQ
jgi:hypothetical protein